MIAIIANPPPIAQPTVPIMAVRMAILPGSYQSIEERPPAMAAAYTSNFVTGRA